MLGVDVSSYQPVIAFVQVKQPGRDFVIVKATEGTGYRNRFGAGVASG